MIPLKRGDLIRNYAGDIDMPDYDPDDHGGVNPRVGDVAVDRDGAVIDMTFSAIERHCVPTSPTRSAS